jgi:phytoene dehydrogenase-like protein
MADASFDAVVIGGGQQGLVVSNYLAMNGMTVGLFEKHNELGGAACSSPVPVAGFIGNPHAEHLGFWNSPCNQDFKLHEKGLNFIFPEVMASMAFTNEKCLVFYSAIKWDKETGDITPQIDIVMKNIAEVARISPKDADRMAKLVEKGYWEFATALFLHLYNPPPLPGEPDYIEMQLNDPESFVDPRYPFMTEYDIICDLFESPELQTYCMAWNHYNGIYADDVAPITMAILWLSTILGTAGLACAEGGSHNVAHALQRALSEQGGQFFVESDVDQVLVENGRACGIRLADGTEVKARKLVIDSSGAEEIINRHLRDVSIAPEIRRKVNRLRHDRSQFFWGHIAFHELPEYKAATWNPDVGKARWLLMGDPDPEYIFQEYRYQTQHIRPGHFPTKMYPTASTETQWDPSYGPPGKHLALVGSGGAPPVSSLSEREWMQVKKEVGDLIATEWQNYAPNMTRDNIIGINVGTPYDHFQKNPNWVDGDVQPPAVIPSQWGKNRPIPELAQYQVPGVNNLYLASGHHNVGLIGCSGYNCYKRIAQHLDLKKPWEGRLV